MVCICLHNCSHVRPRSKLLNYKKKMFRHLIFLFVRSLLDFFSMLREVTHQPYMVGDHLFSVWELKGIFPVVVLWVGCWKACVLLESSNHVCLSSLSWDVQLNLLGLWKRGPRYLSCPVWRLGRQQIVLSCKINVFTLHYGKPESILVGWIRAQQ